MTHPVPAITIGIMTHNYGRYICEAIDSVINQSRADWELIISDDASADGTEEIVTPYLIDPRVTYIRHAENLGQAGNWGFLLEQGTAPVIAVLHADDSWLPGTLETALSAFAADPELDMFYGNWLRQVEGQPGQTPAKQEKSHLFTGIQEFGYQAKSFTCLASAAFLTRRVAHVADHPNRDLKMVVDYEYFLRVCASARRVQASSASLTLYRVHQQSITAESTNSGLFAREKETIIEICNHWAESPHLQPGLRSLRHGMAKAIFSEGVSHAVHGDAVNARKLMVRGIMLSPDLLLRPKVLADYILCLSGSIGWRLFCSLHSARLEN